jgi:hypothetical protein
MFRSALSRIPSVFLFLVIIAVIDLGHLPHPCAAPGPSGFTRIARDLSRKFCNGECAGETETALAPVLALLATSLEPRRSILALDKAPV